MGIALLQHNFKGHPSRADERYTLAVLATAANPIRVQNQISRRRRRFNQECVAPPLWLDSAISRSESYKNKMRKSERRVVCPPNPSRRRMGEQSRSLRRTKYSKHEVSSVRSEGEIVLEKGHGTNPQREREREREDAISSPLSLSNGESVLRRRLASLSSICRFPPLSLEGNKTEFINRNRTEID